MPDEKTVSTQRFEDLLDDFGNLKKNVGEMNKEIATKVSWTSFLSIILLLVGIVGGILAILYPVVNKTQADVAYIRGALDSASITK